MDIKGRFAKLEQPYRKNPPEIIVKDKSEIEQAKLKW
jgi:hypothetical protein